MTSTRVAETIVFCCLLLLKQSAGYSAGTNFTITPPSKIYAILGRHVYFRWKLSFGNAEDITKFSSIVWGTVDESNNIIDKYVTISKRGKSVVRNPQLSQNLRSRLHGSMNFTQSLRAYNVEFVLKNFIAGDKNLKYGCTAEVDYEFIRRGPIRLDIAASPKIIRQSSKTVDVDEGNDLNLLCKANGKPAPSITWTKSGKTLPTDSGTKTLQLTNIQRSGGGNYVCTAENMAGSASYNVLVRIVRYRPFINNTASSPVLVKSWQNHATTLKCAANAIPAATFAWYKDDRPITTGLSSAHDASTLTLIPNTTGDFGLYACKVTNSKGTIWHNVTLEQLFPPSPPALKTVIPELWSISATWNGSLFDGGSPVLDYKLTLLDFKNIVQQNQSEIRQTNYTFFNLQQNRNYVIILQARNAIGYSKPSNYSVWTLKADPPRILSITEVPSLQTVNITWTSTNDNTGVAILDYEIILVDTVNKSRRTFGGIKDSSLHVTGLHYNRTYKVYVRARNENEYGRFEGNNFTTLEADPPGPPIIKAQPLILAMKLAWNSSLLDIHNIAILDYRITITDSDGYLQEHILAAGRSSLVIQNLQRNKTYFVKIQARNEVGYGETANITASTSPAGPPDAPKITNIKVEGKTCTLEWKKPSDGESPIETYTVSVWMLITNNGSQYKKKMGNWNATKTKHDLVLKWNQNYTVAVSARNSYGQSASSLHKQFKTDTMPQEVSTTTTRRTEVTSTSEGPTSDSETSVTKHPTKGQEQSRGDKSSQKDQKNSFTYLLPVWIVVMSFVTPAVLFMFWKAMQKVIPIQCYKRPPTRRRRTSHKDSESSATTLDDIKDGTVINHYETITEVVEMHFNHGYSKDDEKGVVSGHLKKQASLPGFDEYNHLYETPINSTAILNTTPQELKFVAGKMVPPKTGFKEMGTGLGMFPNNAYSHLIHGDSFVKRTPPVFNEYSTIPYKNCRWEISPDRLRIHRTVGRGELGLVKMGLAFNVSKKGGWVPVAVKTLNDNGETNKQYRKDLLSELEVMKSLSPHKHVIQLLGCITETEPLCIITEFAPYGDLLGFLRKKRGLDDGYYDIEHLPRKSLTTHQLMQFAWEIADGMAYLSAANIVHRDLAARNVLMGENLTCKVTDFGLARDIREKDLYQKTTGGRLPVKWTAIEALLHGRYTTKSDVWSFGVVLFEIATIGGIPYQNMEVLELIDRLESGYRMEKPGLVPDDVYALMLSCWDENPNKRPTFVQLKTTLSQMAKKKQGSINLKAIA